MPSYADDCAFGVGNQQSVRQVLNVLYGGDHIEQSRYATFDFISSDGNRYVEVKSGRRTLHRSSTALMGANKVDAARALHPNKEVLFVWVFEDGRYCIDYDPVLFDTFVRGPFRRSDRVGIQDYDADTVFVPVHLLRPFRTPEGLGPTNTPLPSAGAGAGAVTA
jgi:hypothetical protein